MAEAKHIQIARTQGVEAGLEAYLDAPSSRFQKAYKEIAKKRTPKTQLDAYCTLFKAKLGSQPSRTPVQRDRNISDLQEALEAMSAQLAQLQGGNTGEANEIQAIVESFNVSEDSARKMHAAGIRASEGGTTTTRPTVPDVVEGTITKALAWRILSEDAGNGDFPKPQESGLYDPATNGQLYRLNATGLMLVAAQAAADGETE